MPPGLRRFAWWSFLITEAGLVLAATAYVGAGTREFWFVAAAAVVAVVAYAITVLTSPVPDVGNASRDSRHWYWF
jgi:hypothetical protein